MSNPPLTLNARGLARLLSPLIHKTEETILRDLSRSPQSFPPALRRALAREFEDKKEKKQAANQPPEMRSIAAELMEVSGRRA